MSGLSGVPPASDERSVSGPRPHRQGAWRNAGCEPGQLSRRDETEDRVYAALDLGTNNCRLLIARPAPAAGGAGFRVIDSFSRIVRLGEGLSRTGRLSADA